MQRLENWALDELKIDTPFYFRYVNDIILATPPDILNDILDTFNSLHTSLLWNLEIMGD